MDGETAVTAVADRERRDIGTRVKSSLVRGD